VPLAPRVLRALSQTAAPFAEASPLPRDAFVDPAFFAMDQRLFGSAWSVVGHDSELRRPGQFRAAEVAGERVIVARGADLELHAFLDRCVHRGTQLTTGDGGALPGLALVCPYHGLRYDLAGRAEARSAPALRLAEGARLPQVRVARWNGFVLVCLSESTPPCEEWVGAGPPWLGRASHHALELGRREVHEVRANWKLLVQNFQESHHFPHVHPSLEALTPWARSASVTLGGRWLGGTMELVDEADTVSEDGRLGGRALVAHAGDRRSIHDAWLFPGWLTSLQPDYLLSYRLVPRAPDRTTVIADILFHSASRGDGVDLAAVFSFWDRTNAEDREICERQQRGIESPSFEPGAYARVEDGQHAFDRRMAQAYLGLEQPDFPPGARS